MLAPSIALILSLAVPAQVPTALEPPLAEAAAAALEVPPAAAAAFAVPRSNETMEFTVSYLGVAMGKVRLFVGKVDPSIAPVFLQAQTSSILSLVNIRQQLATYLDVSTGLPRSGSLDAVEGSYRHTDTVQYDRKTNKATVREKGKYDNTYLLDVPPDTVDFVALVYRLRSLKLEPGAKHEFRVLAGRQVNRVVAEVVGREKVETKAGTFEAVKVRVPTGFTGKFSEKNPTFVWFSDDARRIVVRIAADFAIGHATAGLVSYSPGASPSETASSR
ncbi:MAG TPA: DUF3108 domain-containing protein [Anaeromyxobacter sp.]